MKTEHTRGPWINNGGIVGPEGTLSKDAVCIVGVPNEQTETNTANAEFICRACNNHQELILQLEGLIASAKLDFPYRENSALLNNARQALREARGGA